MKIKKKGNPENRFDFYNFVKEIILIEMKTKIFSIIMVLVISTTFALSQKTTFSLLGGVNFQNMNGKDNAGNKLDYKFITCFHAGIHLFSPIAPEFYFQPGLLFSTKGANNKIANPDLKYRLSYIELPLNIVYRGEMRDGSVMLGFGPYMAFAVGGKVIFENDARQDIVFTTVVETSDDPLATYLNPFDAGANIFAGYELESGMFLQLNTQLGLLKINPEDKRITTDEKKVRNTGFCLSLGYRF